ncbi:MAG: Ppx/GppA family phosphatase [Balneolales bacterium]|nr:Ppx/GppA family phosphatase [Balneolales bacterium]
MKAAIDIGTNTTLLLVAEEEGTSIKVLREEQRIPRLGKGVDQSRMLQDESIRRVKDALMEYKEIVGTEYPGVDQIRVTATSAVRDAGNGKEFIQGVKEELGLDIQLLSGDEEAISTFRGALSTIPTKENQSYFVLDIGGGSTEVALGTPNSLKNYYSFDIGCVRFRERFLTSDPPTSTQIEACRKEILTLFSERDFKVPKNVEAVGVAGTATSLAAIDLNLTDYSAEQVNGHLVNRLKLSEFIKTFSSSTYEQLLKLNPVVLKGREDLLLTGLLILESFLQHHKLEHITVSTGGIRHGVLLMDKKA